ncbi:cell division topological specificity factor MinE [Telmatospirillum siberiense]|uniref:Cell division topological specificity factor n=1 Tax=Telmatospirillum siberiense TaxID=382514 RepID=A0A2N3PRX9_9PROT|nr:cell division topological specificity factor MinE [Telmatospirillum siberiense]PKU23158.1 cell division topological specificity factor MinE [Telmatospirillum siberiense]
MSLMNLFRRSPRGTADAARERLQILLSHERAELNSPDFLPQLQRDILNVIRKYVEIDDQRVQVKLDSDRNFSVLEVNIELPSDGERRFPPAP